MHMSLYKKFISIRDEIMKHKWIESEKKQSDIGFESALVDWIKNHQSVWLESNKRLDKPHE